MLDNTEDISAAQTNNRSKAAATLDIIIPVYNEEAGINHLIDTLNATFSENACVENGISATRYIFVDDGSSDRGADIIASRIEQGMPATLLRLTRNFGHQAALCAGLAETDADVVAVIDADLQDPPALIMDMLNLWRRGYDVIYGQRRNRKEGFLKVFGYWAFYRLLGFMTDQRVPLDAGDFCLMDHDVVKEINNMPEVLRFPRGLRAWVGFRQIGLEYDRPARAAGTTKYSIRRLYSLATDGIASMSVKPLQASQLLSFCMGVVSIIILVSSLVRFFFKMGENIDVGLFLILFCVLITSSVQLFSIYLLGAYVGRTYLEVKRRPSYIVRHKITGRNTPAKCEANTKS